VNAAPPTLSPLYSGETAGVRGFCRNEGCVRKKEKSPLTPTLSPEYRGEGEMATIEEKVQC